MDYCFRVWHEFCGVKIHLRIRSHIQKEFHALAAQTLFGTTNDDPVFLDQVITEDKSWIYGCDYETKGQSLHRVYPNLYIYRCAKDKAIRLCGKIDEITRQCFSIMHKHTPLCQAINKEIATAVSMVSGIIVLMKLVYSSRIEQGILKNIINIQVSQPLYSTYLAPCNFWFFQITFKSDISVCGWD